MSAAIAALLVIPSGLQQVLDGEAPVGRPNQHSMRLAGDALEQEPPFSDVEPKLSQRVRTDVSDGVADFDVTISPTTTPTSESNHNLTIDIKLPKPAEQPVDVVYMTLDQTAEADKDYLASDGILTIRRGAAGVELAIPLIDDGEIEPNETFKLLLSVDSNQAEPSVEVVVATILDDDLTAEHDAAATSPRLDRIDSNTIGIDAAQGAPVDQTSGITGASLSSEQAPSLPATEAPPSSTPSSSQKMAQVEAALRALIERPQHMAQPLQSSGSGTTPEKPQATKPDKPPPNELRQASAVHSARTARIDQSNLMVEARTATPGHHFRVQMAAERNEVDAHSTWDSFQSTLGPMLTSMEAYFERAETTNGIFYRVHAGPFQTFGDAQDFCARLRERDVSCFVVDRE